jgi:hypothetical protein
MRFSSIIMYDPGCKNVVKIAPMVIKISSKSAENRSLRGLGWKWAALAGAIVCCRFLILSRGRPNI